MAGHGQVKLRFVWKMLGICAPGYTAKQTTHHFQIDYNNKRYPALPNDGHTKRPEVELGHIKKLARHLGIEECAKRVLKY